jgi:hypothetical protein
VVVVEITGINTCGISATGIFSFITDDSFAEGLSVSIFSDDAERITSVLLDDADTF